MEWNRLLSTEKLKEEPQLPEVFARFPVNPFERDYEALVSSAAFRRLQDKTQVYPLDKGDFVRTRLTHSIEVSTIARQMGMMLTGDTSQHGIRELAPFHREIPSVLSCAALLHDLGNPPYGHFGETVIGSWFQSALSRLTYKGKPLRTYFTQQMVRDLEHFEGNAQAFRMVTKARFGNTMNLSFAVMGSLLKYPTDSCHFDKAHPQLKCHKPGYFASENQVFYQVVDTLGMRNERGEVCRHPLTYLMEAADDIAYATADLEDTLQKGLFTLDQFLKDYTDCYSEADIKPHEPLDYTHRMALELKALRGDHPTPEGDMDALHQWIVTLRRWFMYTSLFRFTSSYEEIMAGTFAHDLFHDTNHSVTLGILKKIAKKHAYDSAGVTRLQLSAESILTFLLEKMVTAVLYADKDYWEKDKGFVPTGIHEKYLLELPETYQRDYAQAKTGEEGTDLYLRILMATDFISGMTDSYARTFYREAMGVESL